MRSKIGSNICNMYVCTVCMIYAYSWLSQFDPAFGLDANDSKVDMPKYSRDAYHEPERGVRRGTPWYSTSSREAHAQLSCPRARRYFSIGAMVLIFSIESAAFLVPDEHVRTKSIA